MILQAAGDVEQYHKPLREVAAYLIEILQSLSKSGGEQKNDAQDISGAYLKVRKAIVQHEVAM